MKVVLDSSVAGFVLASRPKADQVQLAAATREVLSGGEHTVLLPTPALAEVLSWLAPDLRDGAMAELGAIESLRVVPFDAVSARIAADLGAIRVRGRARQQVKVDVQIVATAVRHGAEVICSLDGDFNKIVRHLATEGRLRICGPLDLIRQMPLL